MKIVPNDYCNDCRRYTHLIVTEVTEDSIFANCPLCNCKFDLINDGYRIKEIKVSVKPVVERIAYYTRKVAEKGSIHPSKAFPPSYKYRNDRLKLYKRLMHEQIKKEGYI